LAEMKRVSSRYVMVCIPNRSNYAFWLHRLHHRIAREPWDHGKIEWMSPEPWRKMFAGLDMKVLETCWLDCPWWPDIVNPAKMIVDFFPFMRKFVKRAHPENRSFWNLDELPYYRPLEYAEVHQRMASLAFFENSPYGWLQRRFAHHFCILAAKN
jgi:hypothetical protein